MTTRRLPVRRPKGIDASKLRDGARRSPRRAGMLSALAGVSAAVAMLAGPAFASASEGLVYWTAYGEEGGAAAPAHIQYGSLAGGGAFHTLFSEGPELIGSTSQSVESEGIALDPATGKVYWVDEYTGEIMVGNLSGEGTPTVLYTQPEGSEPQGLTLDPATGKLYWADSKTNEIREGDVAGDPASTLFAEPVGSQPAGIAVDAASNTLYWTDYGAGTIRAGAITGGSAETLYTESEAAKSLDPVGIALDEGTGKLYWVDNGSARIRVGGVGGASEVEAATLYTEPALSGVWGLSLEPASGKLYWADYESGQIRVGGVGGETEVLASTLYTESPSDEPGFLSLLLAPAAAGAPAVTGSDTVGQALTCSQGTWAQGSPGAALYEEPSSFSYQWLRDGSAIAGATSASFTPSESGAYSCAVTGSNPAGSAVQSSAAVSVPVPAPTASVLAPGSGVTYTQGELVATSFSCTEGASGPGLASCDDSNGTSTVSGGAGHLDTSSVGAHTYTVTAVSKDGLKASASISYTVVVKPVAKLKIAAGKALVVGRKAKVKLACVGSERCVGRLVLKAKVKVISGKGKHRRVHFRTVVLGRASFSLGAGKHELVAVKLSKKALKLLVSAKHHRLKALAIAKVKGGKAAKRKITLVAKKAPAHKHGKHRGHKHS